MTLDNSLLIVLNKIKFAERYKSLCNQYSDFSNRMRVFDNSIINDFFRTREIHIVYNKKDKFFKHLDKSESFSIQFNIIPDKGFLQFVLDVKRKGQRLELGLGTWESITRGIINAEVKKPIFGSERDLVLILSESLSIYTDFRNELIKSS